jgi:3-hydroxyacyl-CoA dehydrogenase
MGLYFGWICDQAMEKGISWEQLDADISVDENSMGICETSDFVGLDVIYDAMIYLREFLSPDFTPSKIIAQKVKEGNLGAKTGKGFYEWPRKGRYFFGRMSSDWRPKIDKSKKAGLIDFKAISAIGINEGCRLLEEGVVSGYKVIDDVMYFGYLEQTPGPFISAKRNYKNLCKKLEDLAEKTGKNYFKPCDLMKSGDFLKMER